MGIVESEVRSRLDSAGEAAGRDIMPAERLPPEIAFLERSLPTALLAGIARRAAAAGVTAEAILLAEGHMASGRYYRALADHLGLRYAGRPLRPAPHATVAQVVDTGVCELAPNPGGWQWLLAPRGAALRAFVARVSEQHHGVRPIVMTSPERLEALIRHSHRRSVVRTASHGLADWDHALSARTGLGAGQVALFAGTAASIGILANANADLCAILVAVLFGTAFFCAVMLRLVATAASWKAPRPAQGRRVPDSDLPVYTLIVPLFREAGIVPGLVASLDRLDYPVLGSKLT